MKAKEYKVVREMPGMPIGYVFQHINIKVVNDLVGKKIGIETLIKEGWVEEQ